MRQTSGHSIGWIPREWRSIRRAEIHALLSGILLTAAFPKVGWHPLAWAALMPLFWAIRDMPAGSSFRLGFLAGLVHNLTLFYWVVGVMRTYGHLPAIVSFSILLLLAAYLSLYPACFALLMKWFCSRPGLLAFVAPPVWAGLEFVRAHFLTGFPWEFLGHSQFSRLALIQLSDIGGVYILSALVVGVNTTACLVLFYITKATWNGRKVKTGTLARSAIAWTAVMAVAWIYGTARIETIDAKQKESPHANVLVVQGNIDQAQKWMPTMQASTVRRYVDLSSRPGNDRPDLVIWPETALPFYFLHDALLTRSVVKGVQRVGSHFIVGSPSYALRGTDFELFNSAYLLRPDGSVGGKYDKVHLVPYGEYVPLKKWMPFINRLVEAAGDFRPGSEGETLTWGENRVGVLICYEVIFPELARALVRNGASLLASITNDAWFGRSSAPYQHFSMAVFRAVETRRAVARAANTGISGFIDPTGRILITTPLFEESAQICRLPLMTGLTFYVKNGELFAYACLIAVLIGALFRIRRGSRKD